MQLLTRFGARSDLCGLIILPMCERIVHLSDLQRHFGRWLSRSLSRPLLEMLEKAN